MKRTALAALAAVTVVVVPAVPASACSPARPSIDVDRAEVVAGATVRVSGEEIVDEDGKEIPFTCHNPPIPTPSEQPDMTVSAEPDPVTPTPLVTLPTLVPVAYAAPADPATLVRVSIAEWRDWDEPAADFRDLGTVAPNPLRRWKDDRWSLTFSARVTIPADLPPGRYVLNAAQVKGVWFGEADVTVVDALSATGSATGDLVRIGLLSLAAGAGALAAGRRRAARGW